MVAQEEESGYWQSQPDLSLGDDDKLVVYRQNDITVASIEVLVCLKSAKDSSKEASSFILICSFNLCSSAGAWMKWQHLKVREVNGDIKIHQIAPTNLLYEW